MIFTEVVGIYDKENECFIPDQDIPPKAHIAIWKDIEEEQQAILDEAQCAGNT